MGFDDVTEILGDVWDGLIEGAGYIFSFEWFSDIGEFFSNAFESIGDLGNSPLTNIWFWLFYIALFASVWILPAKLGLADYTLWEKLIYTVVFFIIDWIIISNFID